MNARYLRISVATFASLVAFACASPHIARVDQVLFGGPCGENQICEFPNVCGPTSGVCEPSHAVGEGGSCVVTDDCTNTLYCNRGLCAPAGDGELGTACDSTGDCVAELRCNLGGYLGECGPAGNAYRGDPCTAGSDCMAGLVCSPATNTCETTLGVSEGAGPDGAPLAPWLGATCPDAFSFDGDFRVRFAIDQPGDDFFRHPYPDDSRIKNGKVTLAGFPHPPLASAPGDIVGRFLTASQADLTGFGPNQTVFLRFSGPPRFRRACSVGDAACLAGSLDGDTPGVYVVDLTRTSNAFSANPFSPVSYNWFASTNTRPYLCAPYLSLAPAASSPWRPGHTYLVFVHSRVRGSNDTAIVQSPDFAAMLANTTPVDARLSQAYTAYEPLRAWLAAAPTYPTGDPNAGQAVLKAHVAGGALFTVRDPTLPMVALKAAVDAMAAPAVASVAACEVGQDAGCQDAATSGFIEVHGTVTLPSFQQGNAPFENTGGAIVFEAGDAAIMQSSTAVRVAVAVPDVAVPSAGWPVVLYAHGTGGDYRSGISEGLATLLTANGFALVGFDLPLHGPRKGSSTTDTELLVFNLLNPRAARGNALQGAADILSLKKALSGLSTALQSLPVAPSKLDLTKVSFLGHSQGAASGVLAMAQDTSISVVTLSGAGAGLIDTLSEKTSPTDLTQLLPFVFADPSLLDSDASPPRLFGRRHPVFSIVQGYLEEADPANYALSLRAKHVLHFVGKADSFTPNTTGMTLGRLMDAPFVDAASGLVAPEDLTATPPVRSNRTLLTRATSIHVPTGGKDGHFVMFDEASAQTRLVEWLSTWVSDGSAIPTVVP